MSKKRTMLFSHGDPDSELSVQRRLQWIQEQNPGRTVYIPDERIKEDPALQRAVQELDWLQPESHRARRQVASLSLTLQNAI